MNSFQYISAGDPGEAVGLVGKNGRYLAGGIDLLGEMKDYIVSPDVLVDVKKIANSGLPAISGVTVPQKSAPVHVSDDQARGSFSGNAPDHWYLGALTTIAEIADHPDIQAKLPGLAQAAGQVGSPQIRNVATLGGNLLQHSRCWYYRQPDLVCLKRGGDKCYAPEGENKYLALFSGCACVTAFTSNLGVMLSALDATVLVQRTAGKNDASRPVSLRGLYAKAWSDPHAHNSLAPSDLLHTVAIPFNRAKSAYRQQSEKSEFDWALVSCGAAGNLRDGKIHDARVTLGGVAPVPYFVPEANHFLNGKPLTDETASRAADLILKEAKPLSQNGYKIPLAHTLIRRTLLALND